jgi:ketosteroid isomerase-like protein
VNGVRKEAGAVLDRLVAAVNGHDIDSLVACFADDYVNETPAHPSRGFRGSEQVRRNWTEIFASVRDVRARVQRTAVDGPTVWTEWEMSGTRDDGASFLMRGVVIFGVIDDAITSARFYLEPVEESGGDVDAATRRLVGDTSGHDGKERS